MKVFLGGTCNNSTWRESLIPKLEIDYFNPVVDEWSEEAYQAEIKAKSHSDYFLYVITPKYTGYYSFAEVINESHHFSNRTLFCFLEEDGEEVLSPEDKESLVNLGDKVVENGGLWFDNLEEVAHFLNTSSEAVVQADRYDFFISYGRKHSNSLASRLRHSLSKKDKTIWLDKFNIPTGVDFQETINEGIKRSDSFIYIISPHSVKSEYCGKELSLAISYGKRIIPILHVTEDGLEEFMHPDIQKLNWIYFDSEQRFHHGLSDLIQLTEFDRDYVQEHTKWLKKAAEWESHERKKDFLLGDTEVILSDAWLIESLEKTKEPAPSELHTSYITESKIEMAARAKRKRRNALLIKGLSVLTGIALIAVIWFITVAVEKTKEAIAARKDQLDAQSGLEKSRDSLELVRASALAAQDSLVLVQEEARLAIEKKELEVDSMNQQVVQAVQEARRQNDLADLAKQEAQNAQDTAKLAQNDARKAFNEAQMAQDSARIARQELLRLEEKKDTLAGQLVAGQLFQKANELKKNNKDLSKKLSVFAYQLNEKYNNNAINDDAYQVFENLNLIPKPVSSKIDPEIAIDRIAIGNNYFITKAVNGKAKLWEKNGKLPPTTLDQEIIAATKIYDSKYIAFTSSDNRILPYKIEDEKFIARRPIPMEQQIHDISSSEDGVIVSLKNAVILYQWQNDGELIEKSKWVQSPPKKSKVKAKGPYRLVSNGQDLYSLAKNAPPAKIWSFEDEITAIEITDSGVVFLGDAKGFVHSLDLSEENPDTIKFEKIGDQTNHPITQIRYNASQHLVFSSSYDKTVRIWEVDTSGKPLIRSKPIVYESPTWIRDFHFSDDGNWVALVGDEEIVRFIPSNYKFIYDDLAGNNKISKSELDKYIKENKKMVLDLFDKLDK